MQGPEAPKTSTAAIPDFSRLPMMGMMHMGGFLKAQSDLIRVMEESGKAWFAMAQRANDAGTQLASDLRGAAPGEVASLCSNWLQQSAAECTMANGRIAALWGDFCSRAMSTSLGDGAAATSIGATAAGQTEGELPKTARPTSKTAA
jgi:hypothetical protein